MTLPLAGLDETVPSFEQTLGIVLKDNAVKQEAERTLELQKSAVRCLALLNKLASPGASLLPSSRSHSMLTRARVCSCACACAAATPKFSNFVDATVATGKMAAEVRSFPLTGLDHAPSG